MAKKYDAGVKEYRDLYWAPDYVPLDTDLLACFKVVGQEGVPREEVAAAVAAESSTGTWSTVWSELLTDLEFYKGRAYRIEDVPGDKDAFYTFIAYPLDFYDRTFFEQIQRISDESIESVFVARNVFDAIRTTFVELKVSQQF